MSSSITVVWEDPNASPILVTIKNSSGYNSDQFTVGGVAATFPYSITATTKFVTAKDDTYILSVLVDGQEAAQNPDSAQVVHLDNNGVVVKPSLDGVQRNTATLDRRTTAARIPSLLVAQPAVMGTPPTFAVSGPGGSSPIATPVQYAFDDERVTHLGALNLQINQLGSFYYQNQTANGWTPQPCATEFDHYGDDLAIRFRCAQTNSSWFWVWVDGQPATAAPVQLTTFTSGGSLSFYRITFGSVAMRRIRVYRYLADWGGIDVPPTHAVWATPKGEPKLFVYGDSFIEGTGSTAAIVSMGATLGRVLGMETFLSGQGGTGYIAPSTGAKRAFPDTNRLSKVIAADPDYVLFFGSQNDDGLSGVQDAAASTFSQLATALPNAKVIVVGPQTVTGSPSASRQANRDSVKAAALAAPNVLGFIDPLLDAQGTTWISGTGTSTAPAGDGNADVFTSGTSASHPTQAGHDYYARRMAQEIAALLAT